MAGGRLRIVSHFPGRLRVRAEAFRDAAFGAAIAGGLAEEDGVLSASATALTGSLLVTYDAHKLQLPWLVQLIARVADLDGLEADHDGTIQTLDGAAMRATFDRWNAAMQRASRGRLDARTAVPGTLAGLGVLKLLFGRVRVPEWYDLLFWSFVTFVNLNPPAAASAGDADVEAAGDGATH